MGETTIEWTVTPHSDGIISPGYTFNPWIGCTKVSTGCKNCYAETLMTRKPRWAETWGPRGKRIKTSKAYWRKPLLWNKQAREKGRHYKVFCGSLCDVFENKDDQPELDEWRIDLFKLINQTPHLDWLLLTKRPQNADSWKYGFGLNVWLGASLENQEQADKRIPELLKHPARIHFLSCEPLLSPIDISFFMDSDPAFLTDQRIDWVICGGESGPRRRPMNPDWARSIRDQCQEHAVPFFMKQIDKKQLIPDDLMIREFPYPGYTR